MKQLQIVINLIRKSYSGRAQELQVELYRPLTLLATLQHQMGDCVAAASTYWEAMGSLNEMIRLDKAPYLQLGIVNFYCGANNSKMAKTAAKEAFRLAQKTMGMTRELFLLLFGEFYSGCI